MQAKLNPTHQHHLTFALHSTPFLKIPLDFSSVSHIVMKCFQQRLSLQRSKLNSAYKSGQGRRGHAAAAAAALIFTCSVATACAAQVAAPYSLGTWSSASLVVARQALAATSLPNFGLALFGGGFSVTSTCCHVDFRCFECGLLYAGSDCGDIVQCWLCVDGGSCGIALRSGHRQQCRYLQRHFWSLEHCSTQRS